MNIQFKKSAITIAILLGLGLPISQAQTATVDNTLVQQHDANTWLEIDAAGFENNLQILRKDVLNHDTAICAVMKSDAYGHGVSLLIHSVMKLGIDRICVANNSEARSARLQGYQGKIIRIRIASMKEIEEGLALDIEEMSGSLTQIKALSQLGNKHQRDIRIHFNLNSAGMSRNGLEIDTDIGKKDALEILKLPHINITGIMTHFPDEETDAIKKGLAQFKLDADWIMRQGKLDRKNITLHCANTFATTRVPETHLDMVRVGSMLYGMNASHLKKVKPVMSMKTTVGSVHNYKKGDTVVYDRTFTLQRDSQLANLPLGYSDGYNRSFSNRAQVLINGKRFPIVGKITMNTVMVDVTGSNIKPGDEVVLLGEQGQESISMNELMASSYTFYGEFFMNVGYANPRFLK
ncbi:MAG: alanine racemase [Gammaproteobacteria bacterium]|nr:alanine racemase [Gammaproteobacteria bacterium]